eukprot:Awhi_evm1s15336
MGKISPIVQCLAIHDKGQQHIRFDPNFIPEGDERGTEDQHPTTLTEFFKLNQTSALAREYCYHELPKRFSWNPNKKTWTARKYTQKNESIGRVYMVSPKDQDRFYLRLLLHHVKGPTCFENIKTVGDTQHDTYKEACRALLLLDDDTELENSLLEAQNSEMPDKMRQLFVGDTQHDTYKDACRALLLLDDDTELENSLLEAQNSEMPDKMRQLFVTILLFCNPGNAFELWEDFKDAMSEDFNQHANRYDLALVDLEDLLRLEKKTLADFHLPEVQNRNRQVNALIVEHRNYQIPSDLQEKIDSLNVEQRLIFNEIIELLENESTNEFAKTFFVDGPGGSGKTFLYNTLLAAVRSKGHIALSVASINSLCNIDKQSLLADLVRDTNLILWDEAPMMSRYLYEALDRSLQDLCSNNLPFGGKIVIFGGDFRQVLPVVPRGGRAAIVGLTLKRSNLWKGIRSKKLSINMRVLNIPREDPLYERKKNFNDFVMRVGNGEEPVLPGTEDTIKIPDEMLLRVDEDEDETTKINTLIQSTFGNIKDHYHDEDYFSDRAILSTKNIYVDDINDEISKMCPGNFKVYKSIDSACDNDQNPNLYPQEFLNTLKMSGLPQHELKLKIGQI